MSIFNGDKSVLVGRIITVLVAGLFLFSALGKLSSNAQVIENWPKLGWERASFIVIGAVELACVILYLIPATAMIGAILLTGYMGGAIATHVRIEESIVLHIVIGVMIWVAVYLRDRRLRALLPLRSLS